MFFTVRMCVVHMQICKLLGGNFKVFAPHGQPVASIGVKSGVEKLTFATKGIIQSSVMIRWPLSKFCDHLL